MPFDRVVSGPGIRVGPDPRNAGTCWSDVREVGAFRPGARTRPSVKRAAGHAKSIDEESTAPGSISSRRPPSKVACRQTDHDKQFASLVCGSSSTPSTDELHPVSHPESLRWTGPMASISVRKRCTRTRGRTGLASATLVVGMLVNPVTAADPRPPTPIPGGPLQGRLTVVTPFDPPDERWLAGHRGVDLAGLPLAPVLAPASGTVVFAGSVAGRPVLSIDHGGGLRTTYEPVRATVQEGEPVQVGETVAHLMAGHPGCPVDACLHWGARWSSGGPSRSDDDYIDPMELLSVDNRPIRLKPTLPGDGSR